MRKIHIMVVDDQIETVEDLAGALGLQGHFVLVIKDSLEALTTYKRMMITNPFDLLIINRNLEEEPNGGIELTEEINSLQVKSTIIMTSAAFDAKTESRAKKAGAKLLFDKPFSIREFNKWVAPLFPE